MLWRELLILLGYEGYTSVRRWELWVPFVLSSVVGMLMISRGYRAFGGDEARQFFVRGWIPLAMVTAAMLSTVSTISSLSAESLKYWLSLPLSSTQIVGIKMFANLIMGLLVSSVTLIFAGLFIIGISNLATLPNLLLLIVLASATSGLLTSLTVAVKDLSKLSLLTILLSGSLQYLSSVYVPLDDLHPLLKTLVLINPVTLASESLRGSYSTYLPVLFAEAILFYSFGVYQMSKRVRSLLD